jgi:hypothetical protein
MTASPTTHTLMTPSILELLGHARPQVHVARKAVI